MFRGGPFALVTCAAFRSDIGGEVVTSLRALTVVTVLVAALLGGCSRERIDWKSAESADTLEAYNHFLERHPEGELATQARARIAQLGEDKDWRTATDTDTVEGYRQFLAQHPSGKWAEEARIRVENFSLDSNPSPAATANADAAAATAAPMPASSGATKGEAATPPARVAAASQPNTPPAKPVSPSADNADKSSAADSAGFGIQLGAFSTQAAALSEWKRLQVNFDPQLHGLFAHAVPVQSASGKLYRLQAPVGEEARARGICAALAQKSQPCVVVLPQARQ